MPPTTRSKIAVAQVAVIGLGLIGGSVAGAARRSQLVGEVLGFAHDDHARRAKALGLIDGVAANLTAAVADADIIFVATPVSEMPSVFAQIAPAIKPGALVTDCGSTKTSIVRAARQALGDAFDRFVPGHPISGSEFSGPEAADSTLFAGKLWLLAPVNEAQRAACQIIRPVLDSFGARVDLIDVDVHDALFAEYSHAPHALIFAICQAVADGPNAAWLNKLAGAGFRDTTRIGASSAELWTDIVLDNRQAVIDAVDRYLTSMTAMRKTLQDADRPALRAMFDRASAWRAGLDEK